MTIATVWDNRFASIGFEHTLERFRTDHHVDAFAGCHELLREEVQGCSAVVFRHQETVRQVPWMGEPLPQGADQIEEGVGSGRRQPQPPGAGGIDHELQGARPASAARCVVDREMAPKQELPALGHLDGDELPGPRLLGDLGRDDRQLVVGADLARREHLGADALHATPPPRARARPTSKPSCSWTGRARAPA